ncbi:hypothetical protein PF011_g23876 [Phytophthora fragariae]|nr:hypothetical protein PF011_g23876 [Phytophthora fragariae]
MNTNVYNNNARSDQPYKTPRNLAFIDAAYRQKRPTTKAPRTTSQFLADKNDTAEASRDFSFTTAGFDDKPYPTMISYPVAEEDYCDCVTIPDGTNFVVDICTDDVLWGAIQIEYSDGTCNEVQFPVDTMYESCTPAEDIENPDWYAYCALEFDYSLEDTSSSTEDAPESQSSPGSDDLGATTSSIDQLASAASGQGSTSVEETASEDGTSSNQNMVEESAAAGSVAQASPANTKRSIVGQIVTLTFVVLLAFP